MKSRTITFRKISIFCTMNKNRLEAFSDGVFAIVITLLVLNIHIPKSGDLPVADLLKNAAPAIMAYVLSFIIIGIYWIAHHSSFQIIKKVDGAFLWLNILLLLFVSFIPIPTSLMGNYLYQPIPIILYGCNLMAANLTGFFMILYIKHHPELVEGDKGKGFYKSQLPTYLFVNSSYLVAILFAAFLPVVSYFIYIAVMITLVVIYIRRFK